MGKKFVLVGILVLHFASAVIAGVLDIRNEEGKDSDKGKEPEKKPNILKDYICLRNGELCHPDFGKNRGLYVSCSNGVAWEQRCPKCTYHPLNCPTKTLWFNGRTCDWASPKLATQPCIDQIPILEVTSDEKEVVNSANIVSEQESLLQSLQTPQMLVQVNNDPTEIQKLQMNPMPVLVPMYVKSPKYEELTREKPVKDDIDVNSVEIEKEVKSQPDNESAANDVSDSSEVESSNQVESRKSSGDSLSLESEFPSYLNVDGIIGSKIVKMNDPVYTLVNNPDGSGQKVLVRISQTFLLEGSDRLQSLTALP